MSQPTICDALTDSVLDFSGRQLGKWQCGSGSVALRRLSQLLHPLSHVCNVMMDMEPSLISSVDNGTYLHRHRRSTVWSWRRYLSFDRQNLLLILLDQLLFPDRFEVSTYGRILFFHRQFPGLSLIEQRLVWIWALVRIKALDGVRFILVGMMRKNDV